MLRANAGHFRDLSVPSPKRISEQAGDLKKLHIRSCPGDSEIPLLPRSEDTGRAKGSRLRAQTIRLTPSSQARRNLHLARTLRDLPKCSSGFGHTQEERRGTWAMGKHQIISPALSGGHFKSNKSTSLRWAFTHLRFKTPRWEIGMTPPNNRLELPPLRASSVQLCP